MSCCLLQPLGMAAESRLWLLPPAAQRCQVPASENLREKLLSKIEQNLAQQCQRGKNPHAAGILGAEESWPGHWDKLRVPRALREDRHNAAHTHPFYHLPPSALHPSFWCAFPQGNEEADSTEVDMGFWKGHFLPPLWSVNHHLSGVKG